MKKSKYSIQLIDYGHNIVAIKKEIDIMRIFPETFCKYYGIKYKPYWILEYNINNKKEVEKIKKVANRVTCGNIYMELYENK